MSTVYSKFPEAKEVILPEGTMLCHTHSRVDTLYFLLEGEVAYFLYDELTQEKTDLVSVSESGTLIGWESLTSTHRFISHTYVKSTNATFLQVSNKHFYEQLSSFILREICKKIYGQLQISTYKQIDLLGDTVKQRAVKLDDYFISQEATLDERVRLLRSSPFFGEFSEKQITPIAKLMRRREYAANELIYEQDEVNEGLFVLIQGEVSIRRQEGEAYLNLRSISTPGYIFGYAATFDSKSMSRASSEHKTSLYVIPSENLSSLLEDESFGIVFYKNLIWLMGNQLQLSYSWYTYLLKNHSQISVKQLVDVNASRIPLSSSLHAVPYLLKNNATHHLAFSSLHELHKSGSRQERHLSSICLDLLKSEERELNFVERISDVFNSVSNTPFEEPEKTRKVCAEKVRDVFDAVSYHLDGWEHLPDKGGNIFIYNHLVNHHRYTLNNYFQLTLDSHFLSGVILDKKYGDPGMRTVRFGKSYEYGHQDYYENLGFLNVYTKDSDLKSREAREKAKERFFSEAEAYLEEGMNLIISPEGTSFISEESPGPFKMGPFNIAQHAKTEPYIVPVVFYNFDKRITKKHFFCRILKPFKISQEIQPDQSLKEFVSVYQNKFKKEVSQAREESDQLFRKTNT